MLLHELSLKLSNVSLAEIIAALVEKRKISTAAGKNAVVILFPNKNYVYRVWSTDNGYEEFLQYASKNSSKYLVKLLSKIRTTKVKDLEIKYVKLEKLEPLKSGQNTSALNAVYDTVGELGKAELKDMQFDGFIETVISTVEEFSEEDEADVLRRFLDKNEAFFKVCYDLACQGYKDLHPGNVMQRGKDMVIVDPNYVHSDEISVANILTGKTSKD